jgi:hypothetical protein
MWGCGSGDDGDAGADKAPQVQVEVQQQSHSMIPPAVEPPEAIEDIYVNPYFDEAGSITELAVAPGDTFSLYIFGETIEPFHVAATEFRFDVPAGVVVVGKKTFNDRVLTMGDYSSDFVMGYQCTPPGKFNLMRYTCKVLDDCRGGKIELSPGVNAEGVSFLGFVACKPETERLPATGGSATLTIK